jgi:UDP:flavonoid glycosyltransferase YjiC (YdhE family)
VILDGELLDALVDAVAALGTVDVIALVPPGVAHRLTDSRGHVRYLPFTPIGPLLDDVTVVVAAGGAGTVLAALSRSIPMVLLPLGAEKPMNAERVAAAGAGITIGSPGEAADAVTTALAEPSYRTAAGHIADQIRAAPEPGKVWAQLRDRL